MARHNGEGSVYFDASKKRWRAALVMPDGRRRTRSAVGEAEAKAHLRAMHAEVARSGGIVDGNVTVDKLLDEWRERALSGRNLAAATTENYEWCCEVLSDAIGTRRLRSLRPEHVEDAFAHLASNPRPDSGRPIGRASLVKIRSVLAQAIDFGIRRDLVTRNVARLVELPAQAERSKPGRAFTVEQARSLLEAAVADRLHALWLMMLMLGLRPGEATGVSWTDIDVDAGVVHVRRSLKWLAGGSHVVDERLKTSRSRRSLDAPPQLVKALRQHHARQSEEKLESGPLWSNPDDLVFVTTASTPISPSNLRRSFDRLCLRAGLAEEVESVSRSGKKGKRIESEWSPNHLRHSAASIMSAAGVPIETIADQLGHDGTRMGLLVYRHAVRPTVNGARALGEALG